MLQTILPYLVDRRGASAIEYALIAAGIALVIIAAAFLLGDEVAATFTDTQTGLANI